MAFDLIREIPDVSLAAEFDGEPLVQSFVVPMTRGRVGRVWITTAEAFTVPAFGRPWVAAQLVELQAALGTRAFNRALVSGVRLRAEVPAAEALLAA
ncbi:MAG TPA: hypothetical protein VI300_26635 [Solirubrobacter sp.]